jgi:hypothetical protein
MHATFTVAMIQEKQEFFLKETKFEKCFST